MNYLDLEQRIIEQDKQIIRNQIETKVLKTALYGLVEKFGGNKEDLDHAFKMESLAILNAVKAQDPGLASELATQLMGAPLEDL